MSKYYVIKNKVDGKYFRGKGMNRWGAQYNQATIYRVEGQAKNSCKEIAMRRHIDEDPEVVGIQIFEDLGIELAPKNQTIRETIVDIIEGVEHEINMEDKHIVVADSRDDIVQKYAHEYAKTRLELLKAALTAYCTKFED